MFISERPHYSLAQAEEINLHQKELSITFEEISGILGLQPRDKASMLGVKTKEYFLEEFT